MHEYTAVIEWRRNGAPFLDLQFSRGHRWRFDGGIEVAGSSSPLVVPPPLSETAAVDPEEALVASLSSCHMLWFLFIAAKRGFVVDDYRDAAVGVMGKNSAGKFAMTRVTLRPKATFFGDKQPSADELNSMHHKAHEECYIANSVNFEVKCEI